MSSPGVTAPSTCPACGATGTHPSASVPDREYRLPIVATYAQCDQCGSVYQSPMPSVDQLADYYPANYHAATGRGLLNRVRQGMRLKRLAPLLGNGGAVLDFGCGNGAFLDYAVAEHSKTKWFGFEIDANTRTEQRAGGAITILRGRLADLLPVLPECSLITMNHVIEHLPDPMADVAALVAKLVPGGALEGQTPAAASFEHRLFGACWSGYHSPRHTVVFSQPGLRTFLARSGLERIEIDGAFNPAAWAVSLASVVRNRSQKPIHRSGLVWLTYVGLATLCAPLDLWAAVPGIQNFLAFKPRS